MTLKLTLSLGAGLLALGIASAQAQEPLKIGVVSVLTGPAAALGQQVRDGFQLAVDQNGGKLGGVPVQITVIDDELKPDVAFTSTAAASTSLTKRRWARASSVMIVSECPVVCSRICFLLLRPLLKRRLTQRMTTHLLILLRVASFMEGIFMEAILLLSWTA